MEFIKQNKGMDIVKLPQKHIPNIMDKCYIATKLDGYYCQLHWNGYELIGYTSGGKMFKHPPLARLLEAEYNRCPIVLEAEYTSGKGKEGKLGHKVHSARLNSLVSRTEKSEIFNIEECVDDTFNIFNILIYPLKDIDLTTPFSDKAEVLCSLQEVSVPLVCHLKVIKPKLVAYGDVEELTSKLVSQGYEGTISTIPNHTYKVKGRNPLLIKHKRRDTSVFKCVGVHKGKGKYSEAIGALELETRSGLLFRVGSGLSDANREWDKNKHKYLNKWVLIEYESISVKGIPIQPTIASPKVKDPLGLRL